MQKIAVLFAFVLVLTNFGFAQGDATPDPATIEKLTTISFTEIEFDFGEINQGDRVRHTFQFKNTGSEDLVIENVKPSCGCTAPSWPKEPIAPGASGEIEIEFNSFGKMGLQNKFVTITYNGNPRIERISFKGNVIIKPPVPPKDGKE